MPPTRPLTDAERKQLVGLDRTHARGYGRFVALTAGLGALGGAALVFALAGPVGTYTLAERYPALGPVEAVVGTVALIYLLGIALFAGGMAVIAWRMWAILMATRNRLHAREIAAERTGPAST